jgi:ribosomal protein S12 methylthiotransferase accessory factor
MIDKPKFKSCFRIEILDSNVFLISEKNYFVLSGSLYPFLAPLLNGQHTVDEILEHCQNQASIADIYYALMLMEQKGYIVENDSDLSPEVEAFWEIGNIEPEQAISRLNTIRVSVTALGNVSKNDFISTLKSLNISVVNDGDIDVVLTDDYLQEKLVIFNQNAMQTKRPWMLVKPVGTILWIGPIFYPGQTACWECLAQRLRTNRPVETYIQSQTQKDISTVYQTSLAALQSTLQTGLNLAATELIKWLVQGENKQLENTLVTFDTYSLKTQNHHLVQRPQCPCCSDLHLVNKKPLPIILQSHRKLFTTDGGHRCSLAEETFKKYKHHISSITGIIQSLKSIYPSGHGLVHSYSAGHNFAMLCNSSYFFYQTIRHKSGGKGKTKIQAKVSAICEALERYSGIFNGDEIRYKDSYQNLGKIAIHPHSLLNFSEAQYQQPREWNSPRTINRKIPEPFDESTEIEWTPIWSLTHQEFKYIPTAYCYYGYPKHLNPFCWANSNGTAAGNTLEEAILQGFMELVERDSVALWWYNRVRRPGVNLESFDEPYLQDVSNYYKSINREIWVLDITSDLNIPTFAAISRRTDKEIEDIIFGFGSHFDAKIALLRAVTEANQMLPNVLTNDTEGNTQYYVSDPMALDWWQTATLANQSYLTPDTSIQSKVYSDYPQQWSDDLLEDIMTCVKIAEQQNLEVLVLDQTRPDIGLNVVKVVVPGMRHFWKRLAPGRLYDVPVKLGWVSEPLSENQLNPFPIVI